MLFTWHELAAATGGEWLVAPVADGGVDSVTTNSREVPAAAAFLALPGERFDGHDFAGDAAAAGAVAAIVARPVPDWPADRPCLRVAGTVAAYQALARAHRRRFADVPVVAVTGSSGKTSTKEMIASVLEAHFGGPVLKTVGNTNNQIGVPQNLLRLSAAHAAAVIEMGTNAPGEIAPLAATAEPTIAVLTNVGPVHLERLGDLDGVAAEKGALFAGLAARGGAAVLPYALARNPIVVAALAGARTVTVGDAAADVRTVHETMSLVRARIELEAAAFGRIAFEWSLAGAHQARNAALAAGVGLLVGATADAVREGLTAVALPGMRMAVSVHRGVTWVNDAYNANPDSMRAFCRWLAEDPDVHSPLYLVLGDMLELGRDSARYHEEVLAEVRQVLPRAAIMVVGPRMAAAAAGLGITALPDAAAARAVLRDMPLRGARVALKGSRGMHLEGLLPTAG